jgi:hypothetical protein
MATNGKNVESSIPDAKELAAIAKSVEGKEQAPSQQIQAGALGTAGSWLTTANALMQPFDVERVPVNKLRQMRRDPMIAFGLWYIKSSLVKANWNIDAKDRNGPNAQVAAFIDEALREIYARLVMQYLLSLDFGFSAIIKRFKQDIPSGQFLDENGKLQPVWSEGNVQAIMWKSFVPLLPEFSEPLWTPQGEFNGIKYTIPPEAAASAKGKTEIKYDVYHSLWATNEKDSVYGNIYGYPRIGYAYRYWFSYWFWWGLHDRHFEKDADPVTIARYPVGKHVTESGIVIDNSELALQVGEQARSGSTIALPSSLQIDPTTSARTNIPEWDISFLEGGDNFNAFLQAFEYVDVLKLRSILVPEQSLIEGQGGTSSRNVAAQMGDMFQESQAVLMMEIDETINKFVIPQLVAENFPEFVNNGGSAKKVTRGFQTEDIDFAKQLIQLVGNSDPSVLGVDIHKLLDELGVPMLEGEGMENARNRLGQQNQPALQNASPGQVGVSPARTVAGGTNVSQQTGVNQPSVTGFEDRNVYVQPGEYINLADSGTKFVANLPNTKHYQDAAMKALAIQMYNLWNRELSHKYTDFVEWFANSQDSLELADENSKDKVRSLIRKWQGDNIFAAAIDKTKSLYNRMIGRAASIELKRAKLSSDEFDKDGDPVASWIEANVDMMTASIDNTVREELVTFLANEIDAGHSNQEIASNLKDHFSDFPAWKAARIARTATRDVYNAATLFAADSAGAEHVQAIDAQFGPTDNECEDRDGEIFNITDAMKVDEHPNGTLAWRVLTASDLKVVNDFQANGAKAKYDPDTHTIYLSNDLTREERKQYLLALGDVLC